MTGVVKKRTLSDVAKTYPVEIDAHQIKKKKW